MEVERTLAVRLKATVPSGEQRTLRLVKAGGKVTIIFGAGVLTPKATVALTELREALDTLEGAA